MNIKSFLVHGRSDLLRLYFCVEQMASEQLRLYRTEVANQEVKVRYDMVNREWLGPLPRLISLKALELLVKEYQYALGGRSINNQPPQKPLQPCDRDYCVAEQYGLPCRHELLQLMEDGGKPLELWDIHHVWHLHRPASSQLPVYSGRIQLTFLFTDRGSILEIEEPSNGSSQRQTEEWA